MNENTQNQLFSLISDRFDAYGQFSLDDDRLSSLYVNPEIAEKIGNTDNAVTFFDKYIGNFVCFSGDHYDGIGPDYWVIKSKLKETGKGFQLPYMVRRQDEIMWFKFTVSPVNGDGNRDYFFIMENISDEIDMLQTVDCHVVPSDENSCYIYMLDTDNWKMLLISSTGSRNTSIMAGLDFERFAGIIAKALSIHDNVEYSNDTIRKYILMNIENHTDKITKYITLNDKDKLCSYKIEIRRISSKLSSCMSLVKISSVDEKSDIIEKQNLVMKRTRAAVRAYYYVMATVNLSDNTFNLIYADECHMRLTEYVDSYDTMMGFIAEMIKPEQKDEFLENFSREELIKDFKNGNKERSIELLMRFPEQDYKWFEIKIIYIKHNFSDNVMADMYLGIVDEKVRIEQEKNSYYVGLDSMYDECLMVDPGPARMYIYKSELLKFDKNIIDITPQFMRQMIRDNIYQDDVYEYSKFLARRCMDNNNIKEGDRFSRNFRRIMPDGSVQWYKNIITVYRDGHEKGLKVLLCWRNINNEIIQQDERVRLQTKFITAVRSFFKIFEIETDTDRVLMYDITSDDKLNIVDTGVTWEELDKKISDEYIHPSQKEWFNLVLTRENILKAMENDCKETHATMLLRTESSAEYKWTTLYWRKYKLQDNKIGIMMLVQDADDNVREREEKIEQIKEARRIAEQASKAKTKFLSNMTHNMKTPVNAISGLADIVSQNAFNTSLVACNARRIGESARALNQIIDDVLDMSRIESGTLGLITEEFSMSDTLMKAVEKAYVRTVEKQQTLNLTIGKYEHDKVTGDEHRVLQIFDSILSNAVKFTPDNGTINVKIEETESYIYGRICFQVTFEDTGIGMSRRFMKKLFQPFEQEKNDYAGNTEGNGLELAIVKSLLDLMNSEISVKSALGEGTRMTLLLNLEPVSRAPENINPRELFATEYLNVSVIKRLNDEKESGTSFVGYKVLLVDDNEINNFVIKTFVEQTGATAVQARNGMEAYELIRDSEPYEYHLIFMDVMMPVMNGFESATAIRALNRQDTAAIPIVAISANSCAEDIMLSLNSGMNKHISKPVDCATIYRVMNEFLSSRR